MTVIEATYKNGQIVPDGQPDWPEGCRLRIEPMPNEELVFMTEDEQGDDPESIQRWLEALDSIPLLQMSAEEEASWEAWRQKMKAFNIEAVRRQMEEGIG
jgi:hypothetical protein